MFERVSLGGFLWFWYGSNAHEETNSILVKKSFDSFIDPHNGKPEPKKMKSLKSAAKFLTVDFQQILAKNTQKPPKILTVKLKSVEEIYFFLLKPTGTNRNLPISAQFSGYKFYQNYNRIKKY